MYEICAVLELVGYSEQVDIIYYDVKKKNVRYGAFGKKIMRNFRLGRNLYADSLLN